MRDGWKPSDHRCRYALPGERRTQYECVGYCTDRKVTDLDMLMQ